MAASSIPEAEVAIGENGTLVSFEEWAVPSDVEESSTIAIAVATMGVFGSEGTARWWRIYRCDVGRPSVLLSRSVNQHFDVTFLQVWKA